ncbi:hypothetical protein F5Y06DRAFT_33803 [Hypoxylon sp. FL0890]|nr:hypothetical protein F5Y06DRAFT_33803 [Hypoxylon sp. FL0890]
MSLDSEEAVRQRAKLVAEVELLLFPLPHREGEFEKLCRKHEDALSKEGIHYQLIYDNDDDGVKRYVGWVSFEWNLRSPIAIVWAEGKKTMTLEENHISTQPILDRLRNWNPSILTQDFLLVHTICVPDVYKGHGYEAKLVKHLKRMSDTVGVKILLFVEGRPTDSFVGIYEKEWERLETQEKCDAETLQEAPDNKAVQEMAAYSRRNVESYRPVVELLRRAAEKPGTYPQDSFHSLGFTMAGPPFKGPPRKNNKSEGGGPPAPRMMCPMEYLPKTWGFPIASQK